MKLFQLESSDVPLKLSENTGDPLYPGGAVVLEPLVEAVVLQLEVVLLPPEVDPEVVELPLVVPLLVEPVVLPPAVDPEVVVPLLVEPEVLPPAVDPEVVVPLLEGEEVVGADGALLVGALAEVGAGAGAGAVVPVEEPEGSCCQRVRSEATADAVPWKAFQITPAMAASVTPCLPRSRVTLRVRRACCRLAAASWCLPARSARRADLGATARWGTMLAPAAAAAPTPTAPSSATPTRRDGIWALVIGGSS